MSGVFGANRGARTLRRARRMIQNPSTPHTPITPNLLRTFTAVFASMLLIAGSCTHSHEVGGFQPRTSQESCGVGGFQPPTSSSLSRHEFHRVIMGVDARIILY